MKNIISIQTKKDSVNIKIEEEATPIYITGKVLKNEEIEQIQALVQKVIPVEVKFETPKILGLHGIKKTFSKEILASVTKFHRGSLRSGQKIEYEGSIVILGDVNAGAEVLAGENIVVLGILRGMAHAGAKGNKEAIIAAASIESVQIRIANIVKEIEKTEINEIKTCAYVNENSEVILE